MSRPESDGRGAGLPKLEQSMVAGIARKVLGRERAELGTWRADALGRSMGAATGGIFRVWGSALDGAAEVPWSAILKVVRVWASEAHASSLDESHPLYWKREALAYTSGLLDDLPGGVRAPRWYEAVEMGSDSTWLWLEEVKEAGGWDLERYALAAECLGRFNGAYLAGHAVPAYPWLVRTGWPRGVLAANAWLRDVIADSRTWEHPLVRATFPVPAAGRLLRLWEEREVLLRALDLAPHTFCHLDAWRGNMIATPGADTSPSLTLIDWAYPGRGAVGTDAGDLFGESFCLAEAGDTAPEALDEAVFESYVAGLRKAGWQGDAGAVRFVFTSFCALKHGLLILLPLRDVPCESRHPVWERLSDRSFEDYLDRQARLLYYLLELAEEARGLLTRGGACFT